MLQCLEGSPLYMYLSAAAIKLHWWELLHTVQQTFQGKLKLQTHFSSLFIHISTFFSWTVPCGKNSNDISTYPFLSSSVNFHRNFLHHFDFIMQYSKLKGAQIPHCLTYSDDRCTVKLNSNEYLPLHMTKEVNIGSINRPQSNYNRYLFQNVVLNVVLSKLMHW